MQDVACVHALAGVLQTQRFGIRFEGVLVDAEEDRGTSAVAVNCKYFCEFAGLQSGIDAFCALAGHLEVNSASFLGTNYSSFPVGHLWFSLDVHVVDADTSIFLPSDDMNCLGIYLCSLEETLAQPSGRAKGDNYKGWWISGRSGNPLCLVAIRNSGTSSTPSMVKLYFYGRGGEATGKVRYSRKCLWCRTFTSKVSSKAGTLARLRHRNPVNSNICYEKTWTSVILCMKVYCT